MKDIKRIISLLMPYKGWLMFNIFSNLMVAFFMVFSIPALIPFFRLLFGLEDVEPEPVPVDTFSFNEGLSYLKYQLIIQIETHGRDKILLWLCIMLVSIFFLKNIFRYLSMFALAPLRNGVVRDLRAQLFDKLCYLNTGYFSDEKKGNLMARFSSDTNEIESSILNVLEALFRSPIVMAGSLLYMIYVSPTLTIYVLVMVVVVAWLIGRISRSLRKQSSSAQEQMGMILAQVEESISGQKITKAFNAENYLINNFSKANNRLRSTMNKILWRRDLASPISEFFGICVLALLLWKGSKEVFYSGVDPSLFLTFLFAFYNVIDPAKQFANGFFNVKKGLAALDRIETVLNTENPIKELATPISIKKFESAVKFQNVSFQYLNSDQKVLDNVNLEIPKGYKIALVGPSGAGKSTLVDLIPRFYDVTAGSILIDGEDIRNIELKSLRNLFGLVTQEAF
jgi:ABC-type multidrug transport system fused ATPase/permease subunit